MKVKELVVKLKHYNQDARVVIETGFDDDTDSVEYDWASDIGWCYEKGRTNKDKVIIK